MSQADLCFRCCQLLCTCFCRQLCRSLFEKKANTEHINNQHTQSFSKKNMKICQGIILTFLLVGGVALGVSGYEQASSIENTNPEQYRCSLGCLQYPFNLFGKCCTSDLSDSFCQTVDFCKSEAKKPYFVSMIVGFVLTGIAVLVCICLICFCGEKDSQIHKNESLLESQNQFIQSQKESQKSNRLKRGLNYCWDVNPLEDENLRNNHSLECHICRKQILGQKIIKQKCCGVYNHRKCYKQWVQVNETCISCKGVILI